MTFKLFIVSVLAILFLATCSNRHITGSYVLGYKGISSHQIVFIEQPKAFEYDLKTESGIFEYSAGNWNQNKNYLILYGFNDKNIKVLDVENKVTDNIGNDKILIQLSPLSNLIKTDVVINNSAVVPVARDTSFVYDGKIEGIQIKSYLSYSGLLSWQPKIDTLYSSVINPGSTNGVKLITLKFLVNPKDFVRIKLLDTVTIKNNHVLLWHNLKLIKSR
jgi:hypothetical protein